MSTFTKSHGKPEEPTDSPAYMFKLIGSIGLILLGGLFAGMSPTSPMWDAYGRSCPILCHLSPDRSNIGVDGLGRYAASGTGDFLHRSGREETCGERVEAFEAGKTLGSGRAYLHLRCETPALKFCDQVLLLGNVVSSLSLVEPPR